MRTLIKTIASGLLVLVMSATALAADKGTAPEAIAMVKKGVEFLKANGQDKAFAEFSDPNGKFVKGDLYVMVYDMNGLNKAHGGNPKLVGKNLLEIKDANGVYIVKSFIEVAKDKGKGWVDYMWPNTVTKAVEHKSTYVEKVDDVLIGVGIYK